MRITPKQAAQSLRRILVFFKPDPAEAREYVHAVHEQIRDACSPEKFDSACQIVVRSMEPFKRPLISEYMKAISLVVDGRSRLAQCDCNPPGLVYGRITIPGTDRTTMGMAACPKCTKPSPTPWPSNCAPPEQDEKTRAAGGD